MGWQFSLASWEMNMDRSEIQNAIENGQTALGIELGSTRIKAVLIGKDHKPIASGSYQWENQYENGIWTYSLDQQRHLQPGWAAHPDGVGRWHGSLVGSANHRQTQCPAGCFKWSRRVDHRPGVQPG